MTRKKHAQQITSIQTILILILLSLILPYASASPFDNPDPQLKLNIDILNPKLPEGDILKVHLTLINFNSAQKINITNTYEISDLNNNTIFTMNNTMLITDQAKSEITEIPLENITDATDGTYMLSVTSSYLGKTSRQSEIFEIYTPFWTPQKIKYGLIAVCVLGFTASLIYFSIWYKKHKLDKSRYLMPDFDKLPTEDDRAFWLGKIAETKKKAWYSPEDLTTHALTAGATGTGKSVSASVFVEEALKKKIPVIVFDPTVQWTGFVRPCKDENLLNRYPEFGMKLDDARPFPGLIYQVDDPNVKIDFKKYMNPGEITIFTLEKLKPGEYDKAVESIVDTIFHEKWEESPELKLFIVFDEVHRLLEKYGGQGGYLALEKACREFRKWGIGIIMCSQVSADFKEAVQGNILTEIQLNTKSMEDIKKIEKKYGPDYAKRISRQAIGVAMIQNPHYNDGKPWFVSFRPTLHSPHKITEEELAQYNTYATMLDKIEEKIKQAKEKGTDTFDIELELKLAKTKLKEGRFKMAEIYVNSLNDRIKLWKM